MPARRGGAEGLGLRSGGSTTLLHMSRRKYVCLHCMQIVLNGTTLCQVVLRKILLRTPPTTPNSLAKIKYQGRHRKTRPRPPNTQPCIQHDGGHAGRLGDEGKHARRKRGPAIQNESRTPAVRLPGMLYETENITSDSRSWVQRTTLHHTTLHYITLHYIILHYIALHCITQYRTVPYRTVPYRTVPYRTVPYRTVPYRTVPYRTVPYRTVPYRTVP